MWFEILLIFLVVCTIEDPFPGWIDSLNGPLGISLATVTGMAHVMLADEVCQDWIPVDIVIKVLLQAIWKRGITKYDNQFTAYL